MIRIVFRVDGVDVVNRVLQGIEERAQNLSGAWPEVVKVFRAQMARAFATEGTSTDKGAWKGLAASTQADRVRAGFPAAHPILERTGRLRRALTEEVDNIVRVTPTTLRYQLSPEVGYYVYHTSTRPRARLPRRAMDLTADQRTELMHPIRLWVTGHDPSAPRRSQGVPR